MYCKLKIRLFLFVLIDISCQINRIKMKKAVAKKKAAPTGLGALVADSKKATAVVRKQGQLQRKGLSKTVAAWITSTGKPIKAANQALNLISKNGSKGIKKLNSLYKKSSAGRAAAASASVGSVAPTAPKPETKKPELGLKKLQSSGQKPVYNPAAANRSERKRTGGALPPSTPLTSGHHRRQQAGPRSRHR
jgi:hypothetical protein